MRSLRIRPRKQIMDYPHWTRAEPLRVARSAVCVETFLLLKSPRSSNAEVTAKSADRFDTTSSCCQPRHEIKISGGVRVRRSARS